MKNIQGGTASPSPDYPQNINVVTGDNSLVISGKNLFNLTGEAHGDNVTVSINDGVVSMTWTNGFDVTLSDEVLLNSSDTYTISFKHKGNAVKLRNVLVDNTNLVTTNSDTSYVQYSYSFTGVSGFKSRFARQDNTGTAEIKDIQIEKNATATTYEAYRTPTTYTIDLGTLELVKLEDNKDKLYKSNGNWYKHKIIEKMILKGSGSESWAVYSAGGSTPRRFGLEDRVRFYANSIPVISNYFIGSVLPNASTPDLAVWTQTNYLGITDRNSKWANATAFKTWLQSNNVTVYYVLQTAEEIQITNSTLISQLEAIHLATGSNTIEFNGNTLVTGLDVNYIEEASPHL